MGQGSPVKSVKVIGPGKPSEVSKSPWEYKVSKRAEEAQGKQMGQGCPRDNKRDTGAHKKVSAWSC